jgi:hypothetical protein
MAPAQPTDQELAMAVHGAARAARALAAHLAHLEAPPVDLPADERYIASARQTLAQAQDVLQRLQRLAGS